MTQARAMILCDIDGVLATAEQGDTRCGHPIYRTFTPPLEEVERIRDAGIPLHAVTAKVEAEAWQVLEAVGLHRHVRTVVGADRLFWPTIRGALRTWRVPSTVHKSVCRQILEGECDGPVVMIEDREGNLREMLEAGAVDVGILVPPMTAEDGRVVSGFDLDFVLHLARRVSLGEDCVGVLARGGVRVLRSVPDKGQYLFRIPPHPLADDPAMAPSLRSLSTGRVLEGGRPTLVTTVRTGREVLGRVRRGIRRLSGASRATGPPSRAERGPGPGSA